MIREKLVQEFRQAGYDLLLPEEVADLGKVSIVTVYREVRRGSLPARKVGGQLRFERQEVQLWLSQRPEE